MNLLWVTRKPTVSTQTIVGNWRNRWMCTRLTTIVLSFDLCDRYKLWNNFNQLPSYYNYCRCLNITRLSTILTPNFIKKPKPKAFYKLNHRKRVSKSQRNLTSNRIIPMLSGIPWTWKGTNTKKWHLNRSLYQ